MSAIPYSVLDLAWYPATGSPQQALQHSLELAQLAEANSYHRYWVAEHHNMQGVACCSTSLLLAHIGARTSRIRIGSGGVMLPNHPPLLIAEQFGTLSCLYPGRIDLGLGRAPGTDGLTIRALRRPIQQPSDQFPKDIMELQHYFTGNEQNRVRAIPAENQQVPLWILGSSTYGAQVAALLGLPFVFATHFAPMMWQQARDIYQTEFQPSAQCKEPYFITCVHLYCAEDECQAKLDSTTLAQLFYGLHSGNPGPLCQPDADFMNRIPAPQQVQVEQAMQFSCIGNPGQVKQQLRNLAELTRADEIMIAAPYSDYQSRLEAYRLAADNNPHMLKH